jgi:hypothetical protein
MAQCVAYLYLVTPPSPPLARALGFARPHLHYAAAAMADVKYDVSDNPNTREALDAAPLLHGGCGLAMGCRCSARAAHLASAALA